MQRIYLFFILFSCAILACATAFRFRKISNLSPVVAESSGIITLNNGVSLWTHNDSGGLPMLYEINPQSGSVLRTMQVTNAKNIDWEDLTTDQPQTHIFIADIGNNKMNRKSLCIYKININNTIYNGNTSTIAAEKIAFTYPDQTAFPPVRSQRNFDCESIVHYHNKLYLFSKNHTKPYNGYTKLYSIPDQPNPSNTPYTATLIDSLKMGNTKLTSWVTSAALSPDESKLVLLSSDKIFIFKDWVNDNFLRGTRQIMPLPSFSQKEAVCFIDKNTLWITDERTGKLLGGHLYSMKAY